jgi:hypothetical protein
MNGEKYMTTEQDLDCIASVTNQQLLQKADHYALLATHDPTYQSDPNRKEKLIKYRTTMELTAAIFRELAHRRVREGVDYDPAS